MAKIETLIKREIVYQGKIINVYNDLVKIEGTNVESRREIINHNGGVCAVVKTKDNKIKFVRQYRYAFSEFTIEVPAGKIERGEEADNTIIRELEEEVGIKVKSIEKIAVIYSSPGCFQEKLHLYYTEDYELCSKHFDFDEDLDEFELTYDEAIEKIKNGEIKDAKTICIILMVRDKFVK